MLPVMHRGCIGVASLRGMRRCGRVFFLGLLGAGLAQGMVAQTAAGGFDSVALVRRAVQHRLDEDKNHQPMRYLLRRQDARRETVKEIVETRDGDVARLIEIDGKPLSAEAERAEAERLETLAGRPELQERRHRSEQKDAARVDRLMGMLPDAELYRFEGMVPCAMGGDAGQCYRLSFVPNPRFVPPDMEANLLRGFAGEVWIDKAQERLVRLDAHLVSDVDFGFGIIGRMDKGGTVMLRETDIAGHDWELTGLKLDVMGRALLVKAVNVRIDEETSRFAVVPGMSYRDAIGMLKRPESSGALEQQPVQLK
jgi:hypothetical protein